MKRLKNICIKKSRYFLHSHRISVKMRLASLFICLTFLTSCSDFLDRDPVEQTSVDQQMADVEGVLMALNGAYNSFEALHSSLFFIYADAFGGNVKFAPNAQGLTPIDNQFESVYSLAEESNSGTFTTYYNNSYQLLYALNLILNAIEQIEIDETTYRQIRSEALAMRAAKHFDLLNLFAQHYTFTSDASHLGVVYANRIFQAGVDFPARSSLAASYQFIEADLVEAIDLFTDSSAIGVGPATSYFNRLNSLALLSRIYLYQERWDDVLQTTGLVLSEQSNLTSREELVDAWAQLAPISETLLEFSAPPASDDPNSVRSSVSDYFRVTVGQNGNVIENRRFSTSNDLIQLYEENDIRGEGGLLQTFLINTRTTDGLEPLPYTFTRKFPGNSGTQYLRLAEVYLNRAEAFAKLGNDQAAIETLQVVRQRANPDAPLLQMNGEELQEEIFLERRRELAFEGHLFFDLMRNKKDLVRNDGCTINDCNVNYPNNRFIMPIPLQSELINENMVQNEGY